MVQAWVCQKFLTANQLSPVSVEKKFGLASITQGHKHPHHDGAVFFFSGMLLMKEHTSPPGAYVEGVGRGHRRRVKYKIMK